MSYTKPRGPRPQTPSSPAKRFSLTGRPSNSLNFGDPVYVQDSSGNISSGRASTASPEPPVITTSIPDHHVKIVCVGDGGCGKTCMLQTYAMGEFPITYIPTVFENYFTKITTPSGKTVELALWDTAGQEEYDRLRALSYPEVDIILICFSIDSPASLDNVYDKWIPEVSHYCPGIPFILVGLKVDLRDDLTTIQHLQSRGQRPIITEEGKQISKKYGAYKYMECSAKTQKGVKEVFNTAVSVVIKEKNYLTRQMERAGSGAGSATSINSKNKKVNRVPVKENRAATGTGNNSKLINQTQNDRNRSKSQKQTQPANAKKHKKCIIL